jgi:hypothetical protein
MSKVERNIQTLRLPDVYNTTIYTTAIALSVDQSLSTQRIVELYSPSLVNTLIARGRVSAKFEQNELLLEAWIDPHLLAG